MKHLDKQVTRGKQIKSQDNMERKTKIIIKIPSYRDLLSRLQTTLNEQELNDEYRSIIKDIEEQKYHLKHEINSHHAGTIKHIKKKISSLLKIKKSITGVYNKQRNRLKQQDSKKKHIHGN